MSMILPSYAGFMAPVNAELWTPTLDLIDSLGYTINGGWANFKIRDGQTYAGTIYVSDNTTSYDVAWDSNGFISANSELHISGSSQGTVQSIIIDNSYTAYWSYFNNQKLSSTTHFIQATEANMPPFAVSGTLQTYDGTNAAITFDGTNNYNMTAAISFNANPSTVICVVKDAVSGVAVSGAQYKYEAQVSSTYVQIRGAITGRVINTVGTIPNNALAMFASGYYVDNINASADDFRLWINGEVDSEQAWAYGFSSGSVRIGSNVNGASRANMKIMAIIYLADLVSNTDMATIYNNLNSKLSIS